MKKVVRCSECAIAAVKLGFGFTGSSGLYCTERTGTVDEDDGCTFGISGIPKTAVSDYEIAIDNRAAVNGW